MKQPTVGDVYVIPKEKALREDPKHCRRHLMLAGHESHDMMSAVYGSTSPRQRDRGATAVTIAARPDDTPSNGFARTTYLYPAFLLPIHPADLGRFKGVLNQTELETVARALPRALAIDTGTRWAPKRRDKSLRGAIAKFNAGVTRASGYEFGVIITPHRYSSLADTFQTVVPIDPDAEALTPFEIDLIDELPWFSLFAEPAKSALLAVPDVFTIQSNQLAYVYPNHTLDLRYMMQLEAALLQWFGPVLLAAGALPASAPATAIEESDTITDTLAPDQSPANGSSNVSESLFPSDPTT